MSKLLESLSFELLLFVYRRVLRCTHSLFSNMKRLEVRYKHRSQTDSSLLHKSIRLGMFAVSIFRVSIFLSLLSQTHNLKIMMYLLSTLNLSDDDNKQINLTEKCEGEFGDFSVYAQDTTYCWRERILSFHWIEIQYFPSGVLISLMSNDRTANGAEPSGIYHTLIMFISCPAS